MMRTKWHALVAAGLFLVGPSYAQNNGTGATPPPPAPPPPANTTTPPPANNSTTTTPGTPMGNGNEPAESTSSATPPPADNSTGTAGTEPATPPPAGNTATSSQPAKPPAPSKDTPGSETVPPGQELVNIDFPEPTEIKDIIRAVSLWTGKNVILGKGVSGKVQIIGPKRVTKEEAYQAFLSALNVAGLTTVETGKIIKVLPIRNAMRGNLQIYQGSSWAPRTDKMITQIVPLKYINAKAIQGTLSRIVSTNSMIAYEPTNTLIISDTGFKVRRILSILELLDVQGQQPQVALVPIKYADAKQVANQVTDIMRTSAASTGKKGTAAYGGYKVTADERSNSVIIFGPPRTIADVKALVKKFDFPIDDPTNQAAIRVRFLDYADAKKLATTLSSLAQGGANRSRSIGRSLPPPPPPPRGSTNRTSRRTATPEAAPVAELGENVKITADESSNSLLITGSRSAYNALNALIRKLDRRRAQVYIEADILDVAVDNRFKFESSIFAGSGKANGTKMAYGWQGTQIGTLITAQRDQSTTAAAAAVGALSKDFTIGMLSGTSVDVPGIGKVSPGALISMIKTDGNTRVLSSPHLLIANNEKSKFVVGRKLFYRSAVQSAIPTAGAVEKVESENVDLTLQLKPNVSHSGNYVTLEIDLESNEGALNDLEVPDIRKRQTVQIVTIKSGQTAVISGLVSLRETKNFQKIPLLGDIPILGWLFRNTVLEKQTQNLVFFITPHIVYGSNDLAAIYEQKVRERDEIMAISFDTERDHPFMAKLPTIEDGRGEPDPFDEVERKRHEEFLKEVREDMGYTEGNGGVSMPQPVGGAAPLEEPTPAPGGIRDDSAVTVPMAPEEGGGNFNGGDNGVDIPPPPPPPPGDDELPPPPEDFGGDGSFE